MTIKHIAWVAYPPIAAFLKKRSMMMYTETKVDLVRREAGRDWPADAETMIGLKRLDNLQWCIAEGARTCRGILLRRGYGAAAHALYACGVKSVRRWDPPSVGGGLL